MKNYIFFLKESYTYKIIVLVLPLNFANSMLPRKKPAQHYFIDLEIQNQGGFGQKMGGFWDIFRPYR